tara:strand:+ start:244 stop:678 length:435 start_codon:yes stop_codon:yes gene_type:complete
MSKWNKGTFVLTVKDKCEPRISNIIIDLINFAESNADLISWGRGEGYGTMTFKCKSEDYGMIPLFHITTNGQIKFPINLLRSKIRKKEIIRDFQLKLESNFMMYFDEENCSSDVFYKIDDLFLMKSEIDKFIFTVQGIAARLHQ